MDNVVNFEPLLTYEQLEKVTGLRIAFLKKAKREYNLPHYKIGALVRFRESEVRLWIQQRRVTR